MDMMIDYASNHMSGVLVTVVILFLSFVQITPIRINPWSWLFGKVGNAINKDIKTSIADTNVKLKDFIDENHKDNIVMMGDRLNQIYHLTLRKGYILEEDNKSFNRILERYDENGGNDYVHDDIVPRMRTFHVFETDAAAEEHKQDYGTY